MSPWEDEGGGEVREGAMVGFVELELKKGERVRQRRCELAFGETELSRLGKWGCL